MELFYYYLHINGDLIAKKYYEGIIQDFEESDFVKCWWSLDLTNRKDAWIFLIEALARGANIKRIKDLATTWGCDKEDLKEFICRHEPTDEQKKGMDLFIKNILLFPRPDVFWDLL